MTSLVCAKIVLHPCVCLHILLYRQNFLSICFTIATHFLSSCLSSFFHPLWQFMVFEINLPQKLTNTALELHLLLWSCDHHHLKLQYIHITRAFKKIFFFSDCFLSFRLQEGSKASNSLTLCQFLFHLCLQSFHPHKQQYYGVKLFHWNNKDG